MRPGAILVVTTVALATVATPGEAPKAGPRVVVEAARQDAGTVVRGERVRTVFTVRNEGGGTLRLLEVRPSCGCTIVSHDPSVAPGAEGKVSLELDTLGFTGAVTKTALLVTDDPASPQVTLAVSMNVISLVDVLPNGVLRLEALAGKGVSTSQVLASDEPAFAPSSPETEAPWLKATLSPLPHADRLPGRGRVQWRLTLATGADAPEGLLGGVVRLKTGLDRPAALKVPVAGFVRPTISLSSGRIDFKNFVPEGDPPLRFLTMTGNDPDAPPLSVSRLKVTVRGISARASTLDRHRVQVTLTVEPSIPRGPFSGELVVETNDRLRGEIRVPVSGTVLVRER